MYNGPPPGQDQLFNPNVQQAVPNNPPVWPPKQSSNESGSNPDHVHSDTPKPPGSHNCRCEVSVWSRRVRNIWKVDRPEEIANIWSFPSTDFPLPASFLAWSSTLPRTIKTSSNRKCAVIVDKPGGDNQGVPVAETNQEMNAAATQASVPPRSVTPTFGPPPGLTHPSAVSQRGNLAAATAPKTPTPATTANDQCTTDDVMTTTLTSSNGQVIAPVIQELTQEQQLSRLAHLAKFDSRRTLLERIRITVGKFGIR
ncbi:hypothetical protein BDY19DRAFT_935365, partial [Irpex rosettiformis]